jgi:nucleoside-diphosphate-sugar epimerase
MKALVIGGSGFLGSAIAAALEEGGWEVVSLSRSGRAYAGAGLAGDVRRPDLGLGPEKVSELREGLTHVVSCFGSVDWDAGPQLASDVHLGGTRNVLRFAAGCGSLERLVHVSSVLAFGRARGTVGNRELQVGQDFRNWYEWGKYAAERVVRDEAAVPWRVLRLGPVLGSAAPVPPSPRYGLLAAVPFLLRGYPTHLERGGDFPSYVCDVAAAAGVVARAATDESSPATWTWFDEDMPSVGQVLTAVCSAWGVVPRVVHSPALLRVQRLMADRLGVPDAVLDYAEPWAHVDPGVLRELPEGLPACTPGYLEATGEVLKSCGSELVGAF